MMIDERKNNGKEEKEFKYLRGGGCIFSSSIEEYTTETETERKIPHLSSTFRA